MADKHLVHRRAILGGMAGLATAGVAGLRPGPLLAEATQGVTDNEILIGALGQLTGPFAFIGAPGRDNIQMAIEHLNAAGGGNRRKVRPIYGHASTPADAVAAAHDPLANAQGFLL